MSTAALVIEVSCPAPACPVPPARLRAAVREVLADAGVRSAAISVAVVDDATIHELNRRYLKHDWPTDVLSFPLGSDGDHLEGEIVASAETAARVARQRECGAAEELLLYVVHGALHLVGFDDKTAPQAGRMRRAEARVLARLAERSSGPASRSAVDPPAAAPGPLAGGEKGVATT